MWMFFHGYSNVISEKSRRKEQNFKAAIQLNAQGIEHYQNKNHVEAIKCFTDGIQYDKENERLYFNRAMAYIRSNQSSLALADILQILKINPAHRRANEIKINLENKGVKAESADGSHDNITCAEQMGCIIF